MNDTARTILLVDDEAFFLKSLAAGLVNTLPGVRILTAANGRLALDLIEEEPVDLIVTDVHMPVLGGLELLDELERRGAAIPTIVITAFGAADQEARLLERGVAAYLEKPINFEILAGTIEVCLARPNADRSQASADRDQTAAASRDKSNNGKEFIPMSNVTQLLDDAMAIDGAVGVALVDWKSGMTLGTAGGGGLNLEVAGAGNTEVVRSKFKVMSNLGLKDTIEDILITLGQQYHLIRINQANPSLFFYLVLSRAQGNLAMARLQLANIEQRLEL